MTAQTSVEQVLASLPGPWPEDVLPAVRQILSRSPRKVVVLDDDPTGTQTVEQITVVTRWDPATLKDALAGPAPGFFILTNSRALSEAATIRLHEEILTNLKAAAGNTAFTVISRSDSTLRGHFLAETGAIAQAIGPCDLTVLAPFFAAGQRLTLGDTHYLVDQGRLVPVHETAFAQDKVFGYKHSHLPDWVEEKTQGRTRAREVVSIPLETIRRQGPDGVLKILARARSGSVCIVNACATRDIEVFAAAVLQFEESGKNVLYRTAAAFVAARLGIHPPPLLAEIRARRRDRGGLVVVGSHVPKSGEQLDRLRALQELQSVELDVNTLLEAGASQCYLSSLAEKMEAHLTAGRDVVLFTSRQLVSTENREANLALGRKVADALVALVRSLRESPGFVIAKGGITSSTIATDALGIHRATVLGQLVPGVPVWRADQHARFPGIDLVIFPGNVGGPDSLVEAYRKLQR